MSLNTLRCTGRPQHNQPQVSTAHGLENPGLTSLLSKEKNSGLKGPRKGKFHVSVVSLFPSCKN